MMLTAAKRPAESINPRPLRALLSSARIQADDVERRLARLVATFHRTIFNGRFHGGLDPASAVAVLGKQAGPLFATMELACRALRDFDKLRFPGSALEAVQTPTVCPADWSYRTNADGAVELIQPQSLGAFDLVPAGSTTDGERTAIEPAPCAPVDCRRASAG